MKDFIQPLLLFVFAATSLVSSFQASANDDLETAYRKEFAFLEDQKRNLERRLTQFRRQSANEKTRLESQIDKLSQKILFLESESGRINDLVLESERMIENVQRNRSLFDSTFEQGKMTLSDFSWAFQDNESLNSDQRIRALLDNGLNLLATLDDVIRKDGVYFDQGEKVSGTILHLGRIAAYGLESEHMGVLAPAGEGRYQLWQQPATEFTRMLAEDQAPDTLKLFLYEDNKKAVDFAENETFLEYIQSGGVIAWTIVILGVIGLVLVVLRFLFLRGASTATDTIVSKIRNSVEQHDIPGALEVCNQYKGSTARVIGAALRNIERDRDHIEDIISESILHEGTILNRFGAFILIIAAVSPLLGLLGTVTGMISTFDIITRFGTGDPKLLSGGISTALVTTQLGLIVAIPVLIMGNLLAGWSNRIKDDMEKAALKVINIYGASKFYGATRAAA